MSFLKRTHTCGDLRLTDKGKKVILNGWVQSRRDHGGIIFIDVRDRYGLTQIVFDPKISEAAHAEANGLRREDVVAAEGTVRFRGEGLVNPRMETGEIEIIIDRLEILNKAETPPIEVDDRKVASDEVRLRYRYLDLRRPAMQKNLITRHKIAQVTRKYMDKQGFLEIQTPMLLRHTPEGARDFIVPSRLHPGKAYSLPQSPQLFKQILMVSGMDKYFQLAICMRDEDLRADRQPEFTQIDMEMSFVEQEDIHKVVEGLMKEIIKEAKGIEIKTPFKKISYDEAIAKYGIDKPDLRYGLEIIDITSAVKESAFKVFTDACEKGETVKCINAIGCGNFSRKDIDELTEFTAKHGAKGLAWAKVVEGKLSSSITKYLSNSVQDAIIAQVYAKENDLLLMIAGTHKKASEIMGQLRIELGRKLNLTNSEALELCWIVDYPLFEWSEDEQRWAPCHHIFTMPQEKYWPTLESNPGEVKGKLYDLVMNGTELGSGSIRIHRSDIQKRVLNIIGMSEEQAMNKFGFLINSFKYGAPPHGGIGLGFDRIVALLSGTNDIREVIAFPKNKNMECPMDDSPSEVDASVLKEVHMKWDIVKKEK